MAAKRNYALDLIRSVAIIMIVNFHLSYELESRGFFYCFRGVDWGSVGTAIFFILSGFTLALRYDGEDLKYFKFIRGRYLSLFPMFYFIYALAFIFYSIQVRTIHWGGSLWRLVFTAFGADSWVGFFGIGSFYLVGEWFTFAIFILYLVFPLLLKTLRSRLWVKLIVSVAVLCLYIVRVIMPVGPIPKDASFETILALFWLGMLLYGGRNQLKRGALLVGAISMLAGVSMFAFVHCDTVWFHDIIAIVSFVSMYAVGQLLTAGTYMTRTISWFAGISYAVYLWHHFVLRRIHSGVWTKMTSPVHTVLYVIASYVVTIVLSQFTCYLFKKIKIRRR